MTQDLKLRVRWRDDGRSAQILVRPAVSQETGAAQRETTTLDGRAPAKMSFLVNGTPVAEVFLGSQVPASPLTIIEPESVRPGDRISVLWSDRRGEVGATEAVALN